MKLLRSLTFAAAAAIQCYSDVPNYELNSEDVYVIRATLRIWCKQLVVPGGGIIQIRANKQVSPPIELHLQVMSPVDDLDVF